MYKLVVGEYGISPADYWKMTPKEVWTIVEHKRPKVINGVHEDARNRAIRRLKEMEAKGVKVL